MKTRAEELAEMRQDVIEAAKNPSDLVREAFERSELAERERQHKTALRLVTQHPENFSEDERTAMMEALTKVATR